MPAYFTNRALCHLKMKKWDASCLDCKRALDMDSGLVKGHFFLGQALLELDNYDEAIKHLQRGEFFPIVQSDLSLYRLLPTIIWC